MGAALDVGRQDRKGAAAAGAACIRIGGRIGVLVARRTPCTLACAHVVGRIASGGVAVRRQFRRGQPVLRSTSDLSKIRGRNGVHDMIRAKTLEEISCYVVE